MLDPLTTSTYYLLSDGRIIYINIRTKGGWLWRTCDYLEGAITYNNPKNIDEMHLQQLIARYGGKKIEEWDAKNYLWEQERNRRAQETH